MLLGPFAFVTRRIEYKHLRCAKNKTYYELKLSFFQLFLCLCKLNINSIGISKVFNLQNALDENAVNDICAENTKGFIAPANYNCPGQIVISGERIALEEITENLKARGAKRVIELNTAGPFHTKMLKDASIKLREQLEDITINSSKNVVIKNIDGKAYKDSEDVKDILSKHITNPVRFEDGIKEMIDMGIDTFVEIGPGKTLSGFVKKINKDVKVVNINNSESLKLALEELSI